jgi:hypothetical protein
LQHFIRRATFATQTPDFGFLVPTPTRPTLGVSSDAAFQFLQDVTAPEIVHVPRFEFVHVTCNKVDTGAGKVQVLDWQRVAGYAATVLRADSAVALNKWLAKNKYTTGRDLTVWLEPYVKARWIITAFKIAKEANEDGVATAAVRMSFRAEKPFFPYSEPAQQMDSESKRGAGRLLRIFLLADGRYEGLLGNKQDWPGKTVWAGALRTEFAAELAKKIGVTNAPQHSWLTAFEDDASPRPGTADLFLARSSNQAELRRPPIKVIQTYIVGGWVCLGVVVLLLAWTIVRNVRRSGPRSTC